MIKKIIQICTILIFLAVAILPFLRQIGLVIPFDKEFVSLFDQRVVLIFTRTILIALGAATLAMVIGTLLAFLFEYTNLPFKNFFQTLSFLPLLIPPYIVTISWIQFSFPFSIYNPGTVIFILGLAFYPLVTFIVKMALRNISRNLEDSARILYPLKKVLRKITLPLVFPHILMAGFFVFVLSISEYGVPAFLRVNTLSAEIFFQFATFYNVESAIILSIPAIFLAILLILFYNFWVKKRCYITISTFLKKNKEGLKLQKKSLIFSLFFILAVLLFSIIIPLFVLFKESKLNFVGAFEIAGNSILNSLWLAVLGTTIITTFSFFLAYFFQKSKHMDILILLPIAIPASIVGISLILFWNTKTTQFLYGTFWMIIIGYFIRFAPFSTKTLSPFFNQIHSSVEESARIAGASFLQTLKKITIPLMKPGVIVAWFVGFILCLGELAATLLLSPPGFQTLPHRIENLMHYGAPETISSLSLILVFLILFPVGILLISKKSSKFLNNIYGNN